MNVNAHPLAVEFIHEHPHGIVLLVGIGNGRNLFPFFTRTTPFAVVEADAARLIRVAAVLPRTCVHAHLIHAPWDRLPFDDADISGVLSTHVLQHGRHSEICAIVNEFTRILKPGAVLYLVFASQRDARFAQGRHIDDDCWAPTEGDEIGVPHLYLTESSLRRMLEPHFSITRLEEHEAESIAGSWAHRTRQGMVHWFVRAKRKN